MKTITRNGSLGKLVLFFAGATMALGQPVAAAPGSLDPTFNGNGKVTGTYGSGAHAQSVAVQSDGKIVAVGVVNNGSNYDFIVVRYNYDGNLDTSFGGTGRVTTAIGTSDEIAYGVAVQSDGKIVVAGDAILPGGYHFAVVRYNDNGTLDTSFGGTGKVTTNFNGHSGRSVGILSDGKIVVAGGTLNGSVFAVAIYNSNGSLYTTFTAPVGSGSGAYAQSVAIQSDDKIVVAGQSYNGSSGYDITVARFIATGSLDGTFNGTGKAITDIGTVIGADDYGQSVAVQSDGKIIVAGKSYNGSNKDIALVRYNANGSLDTSFNGTGKVTTAIGSYDDEAYGVAVQTDGRIVAAGLTSGIGNYDFALVRYNSNGSLDTTFNGNGKVTTDFGSNSYDKGYGVAIQSDGKIVVAGTANSDAVFAVARYNGGVLTPEIAVEQPAGTNLSDGTAIVAFGAVLTGANVSRTFTIKNTGGADLTGLGIAFDGTDAADFTVSGTPTAPVNGPNGSTQFTIRFAPTSAGAKTAALHIASNDSDENPFDIGLTGRGLAPNADDDGDGMTNAAEVNLASFGFDPLVNDSARLASLRTAGLYQASDLQALALGSPVLGKDAATGHFHLSISVDKSPDLIGWTPLLGFTPTYDAATGKIDLEITPDGANAQFYQVLGAKP